MAKIRSSVALILTILDFFGTIILFSFIMSCINDIEYRYNNNIKSYIRKLSSNNIRTNLRGTQLKLFELKSLIEKVKTEKQKINIQLYNDEEEFVLTQKKEIDYSHNIRQLTSDYEFQEAPFLIIGSLIGIFFTFILMFSFCIEKNECCNREASDELGISCCIWCICCEDCECKGCKDCECKCEGGNGSGLIICALIIIIFVLLYFILKACGKHISRYVAITVEFLINLCILFLALMYSQKEISGFFPVIYAFSGFLALANFLGLLLPNLSCCLSLTYGYRANQVNTSEPIINTNTKPTQNYQGTDLQPALLPQTAVDNTATPAAQVESPYYPPPQVTYAYPQNIPPYQPQPINNVNCYNNGQGNYYNMNPPSY